MELRIADYQDYQNYINAQDKEQEQIDRELQSRDDTLKMCEEQSLVEMEERSNLV